MTGEHTSDSSTRWQRFFAAHRWWVSFGLIALFVLQNRLFTNWLGISANTFPYRQAISTLALGTVIFGPAVFLSKRYRFPYLLFMAIATSLIFISEFLFYRYSGGFLQASALAYAGEARDVMGTVKKLASPALLAFLVGPLFVALSAIASHKFSWSEIALSRRLAAAVALAIIVIPTTGYSYVLAKEKKEWGSTEHLTDYRKLYDVNMLVSKTGIANYYVADLASYLFRSKHVSDEDVARAEAWIAQKPPIETATSTFGLAKGKNLIFLQVESLEAADINAFINGQEVTPNLDRLAKEGMYFSNYYTQVGPGNTADAEFSTLNSLYPLQDEVAFIGYAGNTYDALPSLLDANGYHTFVLHGDVPSFWNRANMYPKLGYQTWFSRADFTLTQTGNFFDGLSDQDFLDQSVSKLQALPQPYMATLITLSSHTPFQIPKELQTLDIPSDSPLNQTQRDYLQSIHYTDAAIGSFIDKLRDAHITDNAVIAIYGDHGSFTDVSSVIGAPEPQSLADLRKGSVPLILLTPNDEIHGTTTIPSSHIDLYPTISDLLGITPPATVFGQDLLATTHPVYVHQNLVSGTIQSVMTTSTLFVTAHDGIFEHGTCTDASSTTELPVDACQTTFDDAMQQTDMSNMLVHGNLIHTAPQTQAPNASANP